MKKMKAAVIGSGVIGLTTAAALVQRGIAVSVFEASRFGGNASAAAGGILAPLHPWEFPSAFIDLWLFSLTQWRYLLKRLRARCTVRTVNAGTIYVDEVARHAAMCWARQRHIRSTMMERRQLQRFAPMLNAGSGLLLQDMVRIEMADLINALWHYLRTQRVEFVHQAVNLMLDSSGVTGVCSATERFTADIVVVCAGAWSSQICALPTHCSVAPRRGQIVQYAGVESAGKYIVAAGSHYLIPRSGGRLLVGSTVEDCGFDAAVTAEARTALTTIAECCMPGLRHAHVQKQWAGLRPWMHRVLPLICSHPEITNLFLNVGHFRNGVGLAAGSAALLGAVIAGVPPPLNPEPFSLTSSHD